jgi:hypothetical protein
MVADELIFQLATRQNVKFTILDKFIKEVVEVIVHQATALVVPETVSRSQRFHEYLSDLFTLPVGSSNSQVLFVAF